MRRLTLATSIVSVVIAVTCVVAEESVDPGRSNAATQNGLPLEQELEKSPLSGAPADRSVQSLLEETFLPPKRSENLAKESATSKLVGDEQVAAGSAYEPINVAATSETNKPASVLDRLMRLESDWGHFQDNQSTKSATVAKKPTFKVGGRIHLDSWSFSDHSPGIGFFESPLTGDDPENRLFFRRIRLEAGGDIFDNMEYRFQVDFNTPAVAEYKDMYIGFKELPIFGKLRLGNQKRPLGLDHLNSSRLNIFMERPLLVEAFNPDARRIGVASYNVSDDEVYHWRYGLFVLENTRSTGRVIGDSGQGSFNARLSSSPWYESAGRDYLHWAVAAMFAKPDGDVGVTDTNRNEGRFATRSEIRSNLSWLDTGRIAGADWYQVLGLEAIYNLGPLQIVGEYQATWMQRDSNTVGTGPDLFFNGAYVYIAYMLTGEHVPYTRSTGTIDRVRPFRNFRLFSRDDDPDDCGWGAFQVALRYSYLDLTDEDIAGGEQNNLTLGLVWYFNSHASLQLNAVYGDIENHADVGGFTSGHFTALGTRLRVDF